MVLNKGGYVMINKAQDNVYELATSALTSGKPILWYETNTECYFIDTIKLSGTDIILTKGGKTITIENDGDITESGDIQNHLYKTTIEFEFQDTNEDTICYGKVCLSDNIPLNDIDSITKLKNYLSDKGYDDKLRALPIFAGKYISIFVYNDTLIMQDNDDVTITVNDNSNYDDVIVQQLF